MTEEKAGWYLRNHYKHYWFQLTKYIMAYCCHCPGLQIIYFVFFNKRHLYIPNIGCKAMYQYIAFNLNPWGIFTTLLLKFSCLPPPDENLSSLSMEINCVQSEKYPIMWQLLYNKNYFKVKKSPSSYSNSLFFVLLKLKFSKV